MGDKRIRPGVVTTIRVNPADAMAVVDVVNAAGVYTKGMSFASMVSLALSSLLQTMRDQDVIPKRDGFEYNELVQPYLGQNGKKLEITKAMTAAGSKVKARGLSRPKVETIEPPAAIPEEDVTGLDATQRQARSRLTELCQKKDLVDQGTDGVLWSAGDQLEYDDLVRVVYGG